MMLCSNDTKRLPTRIRSRCRREPHKVVDARTAVFLLRPIHHAKVDIDDRLGENPSNAIGSGKLPSAFQRPNPFHEYSVLSSHISLVKSDSSG